MNLEDNYGQTFEHSDCRKEEFVKECLSWMEHINLKLGLVTREKIEMSDKLRNCEQQALLQYDLMRSVLLSRNSRSPIVKNHDWHLTN